MTSCHLVSDGDLSLLSYIASYYLVNSGRKLVAVISCEYLNIYNGTCLAVRNLEGVVSYLSCLLTEDSSEKSFLCGQLGLALRCYLTNKDIARTDLGTYPDDTVLVQILQSVLTNVGDVSCDLLGSELGISCFEINY